MTALLISTSASVVAVLLVLLHNRALRAEARASLWLSRANEFEADRDLWKAQCTWRQGLYFPDDLRVGTTAFPILCPNGDRAYYATLAEIMKP